MALGLKDQIVNVYGGLGTFNYTVPVAGLYKFHCQSSVLPQSSLSLVMQLNGSTIATSAVPSASQLTINLEATVINAAVNDVIAIIISSSAIGDQLPGTVKSIITISQSI